MSYQVISLVWINTSPTGRRTAVAFVVLGVKKKNEAELYLESYVKNMGSERGRSIAGRRDSKPVLILA